MRRDDEQIWSRVARTVDPLEAARQTRVPTADPAMKRRPGAAPPAPKPMRKGASPPVRNVVAEGRHRAGEGAAPLPAVPDAHAGSDRRFLDALEAWWSKGRSAPPEQATAPSTPSLPSGLVPLARAVPAKEAGGEPGTIDRPTTRKIARRRLPLEGRIDLHGMDQDAAHGALLAFLHRARAEGLRHVIVITGKGRAGEGVLRRAVPRWLGTEPFRGLVSGTREAARHDGGAGALYLKIKRTR